MYSIVSLSVTQCFVFTEIGRKDNAQDLRDSDGHTMDMLVFYSHKKRSGQQMTMIIFGIKIYR